MTRRYIELDVGDLAGLAGLQFNCYEQSFHNGWHSNRETGEFIPGDEAFPTKIALIHSELSEALEGHRCDAMDDKLPDRKAAEVELADALFRILDLAGLMGYDLAGALRDKHRYNATRADHSLEARFAPGGKRY